MNRDRRIPKSTSLQHLASHSYSYDKNTVGSGGGGKGSSLSLSLSPNPNNHNNSNNSNNLNSTANSNTNVNGTDSGSLTFILEAAAQVSNNNNNNSNNNNNASGLNTLTSSYSNSNSLMNESPPVDKLKKRLARKAELARASRKRKKAYINDLEDKVAALTAHVKELASANSKGVIYNPPSLSIAMAHIEKPKDFDQDNETSLTNSNSNSNNGGSSAGKGSGFNLDFERDKDEAFGKNNLNSNDIDYDAELLSMDEEEPSIEQNKINQSLFIALNQSNALEAQPHPVGTSTGTIAATAAGAGAFGLGLNASNTTRSQSHKHLSLLGLINAAQIHASQNTNTNNNNYNNNNYNNNNYNNSNSSNQNSTLNKMVLSSPVEVLARVHDERLQVPNVINGLPLAPIAPRLPPSGPTLSAPGTPSASTNQTQSIQIQTPPTVQSSQIQMKQQQQPLESGSSSVSAFRLNTTTNLVSGSSHIDNQVPIPDSQNVIDHSPNPSIIEPGNSSFPPTQGLGPGLGPGSGPGSGSQLTTNPFLDSSLKVSNPSHSKDLPAAALSQSPIPFKPASNTSTHSLQNPMVLDNLDDLSNPALESILNFNSLNYSSCSLRAILISNKLSKVPEHRRFSIPSSHFNFNFLWKAILLLWPHLHQLQNLETKKHFDDGKDKRNNNICLCYYDHSNLNLLESPNTNPNGRSPGLRIIINSTAELCEAYRIQASNQFHQSHIHFHLHSNQTSSSQHNKTNDNLNCNNDGTPSKNDELGPFLGVSNEKNILSKDNKSKGTLNSNCSNSCCLMSLAHNNNLNALESFCELHSVVSNNTNNTLYPFPSNNGSESASNSSNLSLSPSPSPSPSVNESGKSLSQDLLLGSCWKFLPKFPVPTLHLSLEYSSEYH